METESRTRFNPDKQVMVTDYESRRSTKTVKKEKQLRVKEGDKPLLELQLWQGRQ